MHPAANNESAAEELDKLVADARLHRSAVDAREGQLHVPNHISRKERFINVLLSLAFLIYCSYGAMHDDIYIPGKRSAGVHLHGIPMWVVYAAMLCAVTNMMSVVVDHYDTRANEINYKKFARGTQILGWTLFIGAFILDLFVYKTTTHH